MPGILSGVILAIGRIVGETAALIYTAGDGQRPAARSYCASGRTLAVHMYALLSAKACTFRQAYAAAVAF